MARVSSSYAALGNGATLVHVREPMHAEGTEGTRETRTAYGTRHRFSLSDTKLTPLGDDDEGGLSPAPDVWESVVREEYDAVRDGDGANVGTCEVHRRVLEQNRDSMLHTVTVRHRGDVMEPRKPRAPRKILHHVEKKESVVAWLMAPSATTEERGSGRTFRFGISGAWLSVNAESGDTEVVAEVSMYTSAHETDFAFALLSDDSGSRFVVTPTPDNATPFVLHVLTTKRAVAVAASSSTEEETHETQHHVAGGLAVRRCIEALISAASLPRGEEGDVMSVVVATHRTRWLQRFSDANFLTVVSSPSSPWSWDELVRRAMYNLLTLPTLPSEEKEEKEDASNAFDAFVVDVYALVWPDRAKELVRASASRILRSRVFSRVDGRRRLERAADTVIATWRVFRASYPDSLPWLLREGYPGIIAPLLADIVWNDNTPPWPSYVGGEDDDIVYLSASAMAAFRIGAEAREVVKGRDDTDNTDMLGRTWLRARDAWGRATDADVQLRGGLVHPYSALRVYASEDRRDALRAKAPGAFSALPSVDEAVEETKTTATATASAYSVLALGSTGKRDAEGLDRALSVLSSSLSSTSTPSAPDSTRAVVRDSSAFLSAFLTGICGVRVRGRAHAEPYGVTLVKEGRTVLPRDIRSVALRVAAEEISRRKRLKGRKNGVHVTAPHSVTNRRP